MAESYYPFASGAGRVVNAGQWSELARNWLRDGVLKGVLNELQVYADSSGMQIKIKSGVGYEQGCFYKSDAVETRLISAAHATLGRIDLVVLRLDYVGETITTTVKTGTPAASPVAPALTQDANSWEIALAEVAVDAAVITIAADKVTDLREWASPVAGGRTDFLDFEEQGSAPASPKTGRQRLYFGTDHKGYARDSAGTVASLGETWEVDAVRSYTVPNGVLTAFLIGTGAGGVASKKVRVSVNGIRRESGIGKDFTFVVGENHVDFLWTPATGDIIDIEYVAV